MFVDIAKVVVKAGDGGKGIVSFRHEKFVDRGGPDGGDGGKGGDIIFAASRNQNTLVSFRYQREIVAPSGQAGDKRRKHGKSGKDLIVAVPVGTVIMQDDTVIADLQVDGARQIIALGGKGGFGNAHFVSSIRQAPRLAEKGELGERLELQLELKSIADVGIVGLPNAGKSTFLARVSNARPQIADYPFTTLTPNLGVVDLDKETSLLLADVPGLIEGASQGKGLGDDFLRHVERTSVLLHLIDVYEDVAVAYKTIQQELQEYKIDLTAKPQIVALNKADGVEPKTLAQKVKELTRVLPKGTKPHTISANSGDGVKTLLYALHKLVLKERKVQVENQAETMTVIRLKDTGAAWHIKKEGKTYRVTGRKIERFAQRTDFSTGAGVDRLRDIMRKMGIMHGLERQDIHPGDKIVIGTVDDSQRIEY